MKIRDRTSGSGEEPAITRIRLSGSCRWRVRAFREGVEQQQCDGEAGVVRLNAEMHGAG